SRSDAASGLGSGPEEEDEALEARVRASRARIVKGSANRKSRSSSGTGSDGYQSHQASRKGKNSGVVSQEKDNPQATPQDVTSTPQDVTSTPQGVTSSDQNEEVTQPRRSGKSSKNKKSSVPSLAAQSTGRVEKKRKKRAFQRVVLESDSSSEEEMEPIAEDKSPDPHPVMASSESEYESGVEEIPVKPPKGREKTKKRLTQKRFPRIDSESESEKDEAHSKEKRTRKPRGK
ncbi:unnamed protein product, partial [Cyprideis torosa]